MGGDPNQMYQQQIQQVIQDVPKVAHDKWHVLMDTFGNTIGWANVFWIFLAGVIGLAGFLCRKWLKKRLGEPVKWLAEWMNK